MLITEDKDNHQKEKKKNLEILNQKTKNAVF